ncbi:hypothetical protein [Mesorhizobium sp. 128a]
MKSYVVEEMAGDAPVWQCTVIANSPWEAATVGAKREVKARRDEAQWVRVTDEKNRTVSKYAFR